MLPPLLDLLKSPDKEYSRLNAISGFGFTGAREAIPILIALLRASDTRTVGYAERSLEILTHHTADQNWNNNLSGAYQKWSQWWVHSGSTAPIYKTEDCGEITPLD
jgi:HEAT repeat protein